MPRLSLLLALGLLASCSSSGGGNTGPGSGGSAVQVPDDTGGGGGSTAGNATAGTGGSSVMLDPTMDPECATPLSCRPPGGQYCGRISDGCQGAQDCGGCEGDWVCEEGLCVGGPDCEPIACEGPGGAQYCGLIGDGCGRGLECGACPDDLVCENGLCIPGAGCVPVGCNPSGGRYCGMIGDGCGHALDCGACEAPEECGVAGIEHSCGKSLDICTPIACKPATGGQYCGRIGNGCGGVLDCPEACDNGMTCGAEAPNVCPSSGGGSCSGRQCDIAPCQGGTPTTVTGFVYDPAGQVPLYNVVVYVPNLDTLDDIPTGASCDRCESPVSGQPIASALTDASGKFVMENVPTGTNVPVVIQIGKWRRQVTLPPVSSCQVNDFTGMSDLFRLPRNQSEGHLPKIAVATGEGDSLECLLRRIGVSESEFTNPAGSGRINLFAGLEGSASYSNGGGDFPPISDLTASLTALQAYDLVALSCEGSASHSRGTSEASKHALKQYVDIGGRAFLEHYHSAYLRGPDDYEPTPFPLLADGWLGGDFMSGTYSVDVSFPKGDNFAEWLVNVGASPAKGQLALQEVKNPATTVVPAAAQRWIYDDASTPYFTVSTPIEAAPDMKCGRLVQTGIHVANSQDDRGEPFPGSCVAGELSAQEKALEFLLFDLSSCVQIETDIPEPPLPTPPGALVPPPGGNMAPPSPPSPAPPGAPPAPQ